MKILRDEFKSMNTDQVYIYHSNPVGSTVAITDGAQNIANEYAYDPFGNIAASQENMNNTQPRLSGQPFKFVGQYGVMTEPNGFYYMSARYYDPQVGRFISEDPAGFNGGDVNLGIYVKNGPVNKMDPSGLNPLIELSELASEACEANPACAEALEEVASAMSEASIKVAETASKLGQQAYNLAQQGYYAVTNWVLANPYAVGKTLNSATEFTSEAVGPEGPPSNPTRSSYLGMIAGRVGRALNDALQPSGSNQSNTNGCTGR